MFLGCIPCRRAFRKRLGLDTAPVVLQGQEHSDLPSRQSYVRTPLVCWRIFPTRVSDKAIAHGAVLSHIDPDNRLVTSRVARVTYGVVCALPVDEDEEGHNRRKDQWEMDPTGDRYLPGCFEPVIRKVGLLR